MTKTTTTTVTTTYTAHRGTYNSDGTAVAAPDSTTSVISSSSSQDCPAPTGIGQAACQDGGYRWSGPGTLVLEDYSGQFTLQGADFSCGEGANLTLEQAQTVASQLVEPACNRVDAVTTIGLDPSGSGYVGACWGSQ